jgi:hypothetical protein
MSRSSVCWPTCARLIDLSLTAGSFKVLLAICACRRPMSH